MKYIKGHPIGWCPTNRTYFIWLVGHQPIEKKFQILSPISHFIQGSIHQWMQAFSQYILGKK